MGDNRGISKEFKENKGKFSQVTPEQRAEWGRKGGIAKGKINKRRKETRAIIECFLGMPLKDGKVANVEVIKNFMALKGKNITVQEAIQLQLVQRALKGDLNAWDRIINIIGEKPAENVNVKVENPYEGLTVEELKKLADEK